MTHVTKIDNTRVVVIAEEKPQECELCHQTSETRPYGPQLEELCFKCFDKLPEVDKNAAMNKLFNGSH